MSAVLELVNGNERRRLVYQKPARPYVQIPQLKRKIQSGVISKRRVKVVASEMIMNGSRLVPALIIRKNSELRLLRRPKAGQLFKLAPNRARKFLEDSEIARIASGAPEPSDDGKSNELDGQVMRDDESESSSDWDFESSECELFYDGWWINPLETR